MRASALSAGAFALLVAALPENFERGYLSDKCRHAVVDYYGAKRDCLSNLGVTVTAAPITKTHTRTLTKYTTGTVTSSGVVTITEWSTEATTTTSTTVLHAPTVISDPVISVEKRAVPTKAAKVPGYAQCCKDGKEYASACAVVGVKPHTTTVPGKTVIKTATVSKTISTTHVVLAMSTTTATAITTVVATATEIAIDKDGCIRPEYVTQSTLDRPLDYQLAMATFSDGILGARLLRTGDYFYLTDADGRSGYLVGQKSWGTQVYLAYTRTSTVDPNVDVIAFGIDYSRTNMTCRFGSGRIWCASTAQASSPRDSLLLCQWPGESFAQVALGPEGYESAACKPFRFGIGSCTER